LQVKRSLALPIFIRAAAALATIASFAIGVAQAAAQPSQAIADEPKSESSPANPSSETVDKVTNWVVASHDNGKLPFIVVDKEGAQLFVYDASGQSVGQAPVLIGITKGDESTPGVGDRELSNIPVADRTTPAGRFVAKFGPAKGHKPVLWVDYADAVSLHGVVTANKKERRLQRLKSATVEDNRITFGCINAPTAFYESVVRPLFSAAGGVVYVLPDTKSLSEVFPTMGSPIASETASEIAR
jgi:hypothetical protein